MLLLQGTNGSQDGRFSDKEKKMMKKLKFEPELDIKVSCSAPRRNENCQVFSVLVAAGLLGERSSENRSRVRGRR
jgi:hypothetical protein